MMNRLVKNTVKSLSRILGVHITRTSSANVDVHNGFELYQYRKQDGTFDYERYRRVQTEGNKRKLGNVWAMEENIAFLSTYLKARCGDIHFGICHGTRRGKEQEWFRKYLDCEVIGTEISETANEFPHTIQWDFHDVKPEWVGSTDFIYSNSFDHSYDPKKCLRAWMSCIRKGGLCILEHSSVDERASELDPFGADISIMPYLILIWGEGEFCVREIIDAPVNPKVPDFVTYTKYLVVEKL